MSGEYFQGTIKASGESNFTEHLNTGEHESADLFLTSSMSFLLHKRADLPQLSGVSAHGRSTHFKKCLWWPQRETEGSLRLLSSLAIAYLLLKIPCELKRLSNVFREIKLQQLKVSSSVPWVVMCERHHQINPPKQNNCFAIVSQMT